MTVITAARTAAYLARINWLRAQGHGLIQARAMARKEMLIACVDDCKTLDDLKEIVKLVIDEHL